MKKINDIQAIKTVGKTQCQSCNCDLDIYEIPSFGDGPCRVITPELCEPCEAKAEKENAESEAKHRREQIIKHYRRYANESGLPPIYHPATFGDMEMDGDNRTAIESAQVLLKDGGIMYIHGDTGRGKTWIAAAIVRELILRDMPVQFVFCADMLDNIRADFRKDDVVNKSLNGYKHYSWLAIDDLGAEKKTEWVNESVYKIINHRYCWQKPTVITSNLSLTKLAEMFGTRLASRIKESNMVVEIKGRDRRVK